MESIFAWIANWPLPRWIRRLPETLGSNGGERRMRSLLGPAPKGREIEVACCTAILVALLLLGVTAGTDGKFMGWRAGQDFSSFYNAGRILNRGLAGQLYDLKLQTALFHEVFPAENGTSLFPNAPWFALLFRPLAWLPFRSAYLAWVGISIALYLAGIRLLWPAIPDPSARRNVFLAAASFHPFVVETLISGQVTAVMFFLVAAGMRLLRDKRSFAAGFVFAACLYKPTMLLLIAPMLVFSRRWKAVAGIACGTVALAALSVVLIGPSSLTEYWQIMSSYRTMTADHRAAFLAWEKFIDGNHFFRLLPGGDSPAMTVAAVCAGAFLLFLLMPAWVRSGGNNAAVTNAAWAATLTLTPVLNLHAQHYDAVLVVAGMLLAAESMGAIKDPPLRSAYFRLCLLLWALVWVSQTLTRETRLQVLTPLIALLGLVQLASLPRLAAGMGGLGKEHRQ